MQLGQVGDGVDRDWNLASDQIVDVRRRSLVRDVHHIDADLAAQHDAEEMRKAAGARRRVCRLFRVRLGPGDKFRPGLGAARRPGGDRKLKCRAQRDRREVVERVVADALVGVRHHCHGPDRHHHDGGAIGYRILDRVRGDASDGAGPVVDDHRLTQRVLELVGHHAGDDVRRSAGGEADDDANRPVELVLRAGAGAEPGEQRNQQCANGYSESSMHGSPPFPTAAGLPSNQESFTGPDARSTASADATAPSPVRRASAADRTPSSRRERNARIPASRASARPAETRMR